MAEELDQNPIDAIAEEFAARCRIGQEPSIEEYVKRYPALAEEIRALLPTVAMMEQLKNQKQPSPVSPQSSMSKSGTRRVAPALKELGDYKIIRELGRGGMGIVYEAEEKSLGRRVAVKVLQMQALHDPLRLERFQREAQAAARLHHPNIVPVFGVGESDGYHYFAMQYVPGCGLNDVIKSLKKDMNVASLGTGSGSAVPLIPYTRPKHYWRWVAQIGVQVAEALAYAHEQGTLHRDIKPANILLDSQGTAWVADFGLAKILDREELTQTGDIIGTLHYMAPEALRGRGDSRSDIYGLALTLYELMTLQSPYKNFNTLDMLKQIDEYEIIRPRQLNPAIPIDLETIVLKASSRQSDDRYQNAREFAEDLQRFIEDMPIAAREISSIERFRRWCVRNRKIAALTLTAVASLLCALIVGWVGYVKTNEALERESRRREDADAANQRAEANVRMSLQAFEEIFNEIGNTNQQRPPLPPQNFGTNGPPPWESRENAALLQSVLKFYDRFAAENSTNSRLQFEAAKAYTRVGELQLRLGETTESEKAQRRALELADKVEPERKNSIEFSLFKAQAHFGLASALRQLQKSTEAEGEFRHAIAIMREVVSLQPNDAGPRNLLANQTRGLAELLADTKRSADAIKLMTESTKELEEFYRSSRDRRVAPNLANEYRALSKMLADTGDFKGADDMMRRAEVIAPPPMGRNRSGRNGNFPPPPPGRPNDFDRPPPPDRDGNFDRPDRPPPPDFKDNDRPPPPDFNGNGPPPERRPDRPPPPRRDELN